MRKLQLNDWPRIGGLLLAIALAVGIVVIEARASARVVAVEPEIGIQPLDASDLQNADFEDGFRPVNGVGELTVANGWWPWYVEGDGFHRPEYKGEPRCVDLGCNKLGHVYRGEWGQKQFTTFSKQDGGVYQQIQVERGKWYTFSAWVWVWSTDHDGSTSQGPTGKYSALVGINPWGDCRATYRTTVWGSEALTVYDQWVQVSVTAQAWGNTLCLFTRGTAEYAVKHNDSYWDTLTFAEAGSGAVTPAPTYTPYPTLAPQPTYTPAPTCAPCPTCSPVGPVPTPGTGTCPSLEEQRVMVREVLEEFFAGLLGRLQFIPVVGK